MRELLPRVKNILCLCVIVCVAIELVGCEAFVRKFTRKHKKDAFEQDELVLVPQEYKAGIPSDELYRQYFLYWKSWQDELIESLQPGANHKKQTGCIREAIKNIALLKSLLYEEKQNGLQRYIEKLNALQSAIVNDLYGNNAFMSRSSAEAIKRGILRDFAFQKIKDYVKKE